MSRNAEIDFLKSIMILFMVCFHLTFASQCFPEAKSLVYTFHMPVFLILSGFLMNVQKPLDRFIVTILKLLLPYIVMESGYTVMASVLPIAEHIDNLTFAVFLDKLLLHPLGPYWYLHTMVICAAAYYLSLKVTLYFVKTIKATSSSAKAIPSPTLAPVFGMLLLWGLSETGIVSFSCAAYFFAGAILRQTGKEFRFFFRASWLAVPALLMLCLLPQYHDKTTVVGVMIVYSIMSICIMVYKVLSDRMSDVMLWIGRNTMSIFLFAPIFTILCKQLLPLLPASFPQQLNGVIFITISLPICLAGSICVDIIMKCMLQRFYYR